jgi:hypothetical protein
MVKNKEEKVVTISYEKDKGPDNMSVSKEHYSGVEVEETETHFVVHLTKKEK